MKSKIKWFKEKNKYLVIKWVNEKYFPYFYYSNNYAIIDKGYPLDEFLKENKKYFSYKTNLLNQTVQTFEVEIIFHDKASEVLYFLQN
jgi:hypothetical protein